MALSESTPIPFPQSEGNSTVYQPSREDLTVAFAEEFSRLLGKFVYCASETELIQSLQVLAQQQGWKSLYCREDELIQKFEGTPLVTQKKDLLSCDASITGCEFLVARTGSIVLSSAQQSGRITSVYAPIHLCIGYTHQLVYDVKDALQGLRDKYQGKIPSMINFATGPSRTADIEKTLVTGVHGPKEVYVFLLDQ